MATGEERSSFDYDDYAEEPGGGRAIGRYVNTDTIEASDSDDDRRMPQSHTEETLVSTDPMDETAAPDQEAKARDSHSSSDEENGPPQASGKMGKLFGKGKKKDDKDKTKDKKDKKEKDNKKKEEKQKEKEQKKREKEALKEKKEREAKEKKEREAREKEERERKKKAAKGEKEKDSDGEKEDNDEPKEKKKPRDKSPHRMPAFAKLGFLKRNKKDSNTSTESDIPPPKQTSTPPSHRYDYPPRDISSEAPHDQTFAPSEHSGGTSAAANSDVFDEPEKVPLEAMDPRMKYGGPPPESIPVPMMSMTGEPLGYVPPPMVPVSDVHAPPVPEDTTAPKTVPYTYTKGKQSFSDRVRAPINNILMNKRSSKFQQGEGVAELKPQAPPPLARCSTFIVMVLISGFILGIILTAMSSLSTTLAVVGPCFIGLSFFGLIGKVFFTLWWEDDPLPPLNKLNSQFHGFIESGPNYQKDAHEAYPMYPVNSSQAAIATYNTQNEITETTPMTGGMQLGPDDVPDIGLRFSDSDMDYALRDLSDPSQEDSMDAYRRMRKDSISSDEAHHPVKPSFV